MNADQLSSAAGDARTPRVTAQAVVTEIVRRGFYDESSLTTLLGAARRHLTVSDLERLLRRDGRVSDSALTKLKADTSGYRPIPQQEVYPRPSLPAQVSRATGAVVISTSPVVVAMVEDIPDSVELVSTYVGSNFEIQVCTVLRFTELFRAAYEYSETGQAGDAVEEVVTPDEDFSNDASSHNESLKSEHDDWRAMVDSWIRGDYITPSANVTVEERKLAYRQREQHRAHLLADRAIPRWWGWVWLAGALYFPYAMKRDYSSGDEVFMFWIVWLALGVFMWYKAFQEKTALEETWKASWAECRRCQILCQLTNRNLEEYTEKHWDGRITSVGVYSCLHCGEAVRIHKNGT